MGLGFDKDRFGCRELVTSISACCKNYVKQTSKKPFLGLLHLEFAGAVSEHSHLK